MVNIELDGIWCKKCQKLHPTLFWHKKYNDYELNRKAQWEKAVSRFLKDTDEVPEYKDSLPIKGLKEVYEGGPCVICNDITFFKTLESDQFVCCDECKYKHLKKSLD